MARDADGYSKFVKAAKIILPLIAIGLFVSIFLFSTGTKVREGLIFTDTEMAALAVDQKITNPHFSGVTRGGDAFTVSADWALPDGPSPEFIELSKPTTTVDLQDGRQLTSQASAGQLNLADSTAVLEGNVNFSTTNGYHANSERLLLDFRSGNAVSPAAVKAYGPIGSIEAGSMQARQDLGENGLESNAVLLFQNGVKVIYRPRQK